MKMQYTEEQIARANQTDLVSFLNAQGEQLVKSGRVRETIFVKIQKWSFCIRNIRLIKNKKSVSD